jgi:hypothetical protein
MLSGKQGCLGIDHNIDQTAPAVGAAFFLSRLAANRAEDGAPTPMEGLMT